MLMDCQTRYGTVRGKMTDDGLVARYLGIPFGWIPGRWKRAQEPEPYSGVYDALHFGRIPFQGLHLEEMPHDRESPVPEDAMESETCLFLNIWAPVGASHSAVMVFVPGGGFINGATCQPVYDGEALARQGVVLVTVCHRLGALGFLSHPLLEDENGQSGNYALYDLLRALDWVHETISAFGGDPENVTLFGQSSGEVAVQVLLAAPQARGKFKRAILQSGRCLESGDLMDTRESALWKGENFMKVMRASTLQEMLALKPNDMAVELYRLRKATFGPGGGPNSVRTVSEQKNPGRLLYHVDGEAMPALLEEAALDGLIADVDMMVGSCSEEGGGQTGAIRSHSAVCWCENQCRLGRKPAYLYLFARKLADDPRGAFHGAELPYLFGNLQKMNRSYTQQDTELSAVMMRYWVNFARTGNPNGADLPEWQPFERGNRRRIRLDARCKAEDVPATPPVVPV